MANIKLRSDKGGCIDRGCAIIFGTVWVLGWTAGTLGFDGMLLWNAYRQLMAATYPSAPATIVHRDVVHVGDKDSRRLEVKYKFTVDGREFIGDKRRYNEMGSNDGWAKEAARQYAVGKKVTAYYNPANPADAVLEPGLLGEDLFMAMFLTPFNLIMVTSWFVAAYAIRGDRFSRPAGGLKVIDDGTEVRVRMPEYSPLVAGLATLGGLCFVMIFVVGFSMGFHASLQSMLIVWAIVLGLSGVVYAKVAGPIWRGDRDLVLSPLTGRITLPQTFGRKEPVELTADDITGVAVEHHPAPGKKQSDSKTNAVTIYYRNENGGTNDARLKEFTGQAAAESLADWLREKLHQLR